MDVSDILKKRQTNWEGSSSTSLSHPFSTGTPLTPSGLRKMSLLSSISMTVPIGEDFTINSVSKDGQDHLFQGSAMSSKFCKIKSSSFADTSGDQLEQTVTIIPSLRGGGRRKSMVSHAFPELHQEVGSFILKLCLGASLGRAFFSF